MNTLILTLNQVSEWDTGKDETILECVSTHTHETRTGYLFKILKLEKPLFIATTELLGAEPMTGCLYVFKGFAADSCVIGLEQISNH